MFDIPVYDKYMLYFCFTAISRLLGLDVKKGNFEFLSTKLVHDCLVVNPDIVGLISVITSGVSSHQVLKITAYTTMQKCKISVSVHPPQLIGLSLAHSRLFVLSLLVKNVVTLENIFVCFALPLQQRSVCCLFP